jgi:hypothetical protein
VAKNSLPRTRPKLKGIDELDGLEAQNRVQKHEQLQKMKPCAALYLDGQVWPEPGERSKRFFALAAEYRRLGHNQEMTLSRMTEYFYRVPELILKASGQDGRGFTLKEVENAVKAVYRGEKIKSYGCYSGMWDHVCIGDMCEFRKELSGKSGQSFETAFFVFVSHWMNATDEDGRKLLFDSDLKVYLSLMAIEKRRQYKPGSVLFVSHREISEISGVLRHAVGKSLERLWNHGLIAYIKGRERGIASEVKRVIPIPCIINVQGIDSS